MQFLGAILLALVIWLPITAYWGFILQTLWGWFISPTFGLAPLSLGEAVGLSLCVSVMTFRSHSVKTYDGPFERVLSITFSYLLAGGASLGAGWVYLQVFF